MTQPTPNLGALKNLIGIEGNPIAWLVEKINQQQPPPDPVVIAGCRVWNDAATTINYNTTTGSPFEHPFNQTLFDTHGMHSDSVDNSRITIPAYSVVPKGIWQIHLHAVLDCPGTGAANIQIIKSGADRSFVEAADQEKIIGAAGSPTGVTGYTLDMSGLWIPDEGDYFEMQVAITGAGNINVRHDARPSSTFLEAIFLGAYTP